MSEDYSEAFELIDEDYYAIQIASNVARLFLKERNLPPRSIIGLGNALYALDRLPEVTKGVNCQFGLIYENGNEEFRESKYYEFRIGEDFFEISAGGSVYDKAVGSDSFSEPGWLVQSNGVATRDAELWYLGDHITEFINIGAKVIVEDESEIIFE